MSKKVKPIIGVHVVDLNLNRFVMEGKTNLHTYNGLKNDKITSQLSHTGTKFTPMAYKATESKKVYFCGCKQSKNRPLCDGSHKKLPEDAEGISCL
jgi:CDGSH-type Zn-finger protein